MSGSPLRWLGIGLAAAIAACGESGVPGPADPSEGAAPTARIVHVAGSLTIATVESGQAPAAARSTCEWGVAALARDWRVLSSDSMPASGRDRDNL